MTQRSLTTVVDGYTFLEAPRRHGGRPWSADRTALGGDDGRTPHLCVASTFDAAERSTTRRGRLVAAAVDVPGA